MDAQQSALTAFAEILPESAAPAFVGVIAVGFIVAFWAAPTMTAGRLLFAAVTTGWIVIAMYLEEHDQLAALGARFAAYRQSVPMIVPGLPMRSKIPQDSLRTPDA